jgi:hypothetical protein
MSTKEPYYPALKLGPTVEWRDGCPTIHGGYAAFVQVEQHHGELRFTPIVLANVPGQPGSLADLTYYLDLPGLADGEPGTFATFKEAERVVRDYNSVNRIL